MSRNDFIKRLESLLSDIPNEEREEALQYYNDYFDDAGIENEKEILAELGSPERVAKIIKAELYGNSSDRETRGYFTEKGYQDTILIDDKYEIVETGNQNDDRDINSEENNQRHQEEYHKREHHNKSADFQEGTGHYSQHDEYNQHNSGKQTSGMETGYHQDEKYKRNTNIGLIVLLCILAIPVGIPLVATVFGITVALLASVLALFFGFGLAGLTMMGVGTALIIAGIIKLGVSFIGFLFCGIGLISLGLGMLLVMLTIFIGKTVFPAIIRGFVYICRLPFKNRSVMA
ncbi:MAG: DUF1700 domain-containing protein [Clostridiales bacterium]|nr:DUF1700 domain-containing protein [Clostridiales bacterium]